MFYVNSEVSSYNFFFIDAGWYSSMEGEIGTFNNCIKYICTKDLSVCLVL